MQQRRTMQSLIVRISLVSCVLVGFLGGVTPAVAQVLPPMTDPSPGSTLTTSTVTFTGGHAGQAGESHWLSVETSPNAADIFHGALGPGHTATVSGLPTSGTLYVRYWTYTPRVGWGNQAQVAGWGNQAHTYTMDVGGGGGGDLSAEILAQIAILNDKLDNMQADVDNLPGGSGPCYHRRAARAQEFVRGSMERSWTSAPLAATTAGEGSSTSSRSESSSSASPAISVISLPARCRSRSRPSSSRPN